MVKPGLDAGKGFREVGVVEGYDIWAPTYDRELNPLIALEESITLDLIDDVRNQRVLDVGCGTGRYCELLAKRGAEVVGIDPSPRMLEYAKRKITPDCTYELHLGKLEDMKFPSNHFDAVVSALTVGHMPELEPVMRIMSRIIKSRERLIVSDMHPYWFVSGYDYVKFLSENGQEYRIPQYAHLLEEYWNLFEEFKLNVEDVREPRIDEQLIERFPGLKKYKDIPLALILKARKV
jgi:ubiquinone/menaquinone biosynthesis C-methylase UbiE